MKQYKVNINGKEFNISIEETTFGTSAPVAPAPIVSAPVAAPVKTEIAAPAMATPATGIKVTAPMPGTVLKIKTSTGTGVKKGEPIIVLEAMKMENEIAATADGTVTLCVQEGAKINSGDVIATIA